MDYNTLFSKEDKIAAFDKLADLYYFGNFGTLQKSEIDLLMFSELLDRIEESFPDDYNAQSDYNLSKALGITQARVRSLRERKEIKYSSGYVWQDGFRKIVEKAEFDNEKVKLFIRDQRLYTELKNLLEEKGTYAETTLTRQLLVVSPVAFIDLMLEAEKEPDRARVSEKLTEILEKNQISYKINQKSLREQLKGTAPEIVSKAVCEMFNMIPVVGGAVSKAAEQISKNIFDYYRQKNNNKSQTVEK